MRDVVHWAQENIERRPNVVSLKVSGKEHDAAALLNVVMITLTYRGLRSGLILRLPVEQVLRNGIVLIHRVGRERG
jgi:hypothetical protein